jgi:hypothetical protein
MCWAWHAGHARETVSNRLDGRRASTSLFTAVGWIQEALMFVRSFNWGLMSVLSLALGAVAFVPVHAAGPTMPPAIFRDADLALGERLIAEHRCSACHARKVGGDGRSIYNPQGRISSPGALRGMVEYCSTELNLGLFPEESTAVAAVLNRDHYRFK